MTAPLVDRLATCLETLVDRHRPHPPGDAGVCRNCNTVDDARALLAEWRAERERGRAVDLGSVPVFTSWVLPPDGFWCHPDVLNGKLVPHRAPDLRPWTHEVERVEHEYRAHVEANDPDGSKMGYCAVPGCMRPRARHAPVPAPPEGEGKGTDD